MYIYIKVISKLLMKIDKHFSRKVLLLLFLFMKMYSLLLLTSEWVTQQFLINLDWKPFFVNSPI